ncbi:MAG: MafI family immunity protein [Verrucomicrobiota bacterium]|nr:MafI family immunity protein [Verrucomicrobiota bacterium]
MHPSEAKVITTLEACRPLLTEEEYQEVFSENDHAEWGLAIETLADILGEKEAKVSSEQLRLIEEAFAFMQMEPGRRTEYLRELMTAKTE